MIVRKRLIAFVRGLWLPALLLARPWPALAHDGQPPTPETLWYDWHWEPAVVIGLVMAAGFYLGGRRMFWRQVAGGRSARRWKRTLAWRAVCFFAGLGVLGLALLSPLDALGLALFSAHMGQHMLLVLAAAPLIVLGTPDTFFVWMLPAGIRRAIGQGWNRATSLRGVWQALSHPVVVWTLHALAFWAWHVPWLYQAALADEGTHALEHLSFLGTALLFWWAVASPAPGRLDRGMAVLFLFTTALQGGLLAVLITFASSGWYPAYSQTTAAWGLTPLEDQQLAGALMWIPSGVVYAAAAVTLFAAWLADIEQRSASFAARGPGRWAGSPPAAPPVA